MLISREAYIYHDDSQRARNWWHLSLHYYHSLQLVSCWCTIYAKIEKSICCDNDNCDYSLWLTQKKHMHSVSEVVKRERKVDCLQNK